MIEPLRWNDASWSVDLLDQTRLPLSETWLTLSTPAAMAEAIEMLRVRGAPAIGIAAAYGTVLSLRDSHIEDPGRVALEAVARLSQTRPTAVNLFWALERMSARIRHCRSEDLYLLRQELLNEARAIHQEDLWAGRKLAEHGLSVLADGMTVLTHCHAGGVATSGYGTALAPFMLAAAQGRTLQAYVDETRPLLQGSRITAWELQKLGVPTTLITDSMAGHVMQRGMVDAVIVGADRIAANGDVANKIGTYGLAVLAHAHDIPFYVAAPVSTIDYKTEHGPDIEIEERTPEEITERFGQRTAPLGIQVYNPAFDVTPARLVTAIITEFGVVKPPYQAHLLALRGVTRPKASTIGAP